MISQAQRPRKHRYHEEETDSEGSWAISYGDMVTLLLTFFILFFNVSQKTEEAKRETQNAILARLGEGIATADVTSAHEHNLLKIGPKKDLDSLEEQVIKEWGGKAHAIGSKIVIEFPDVSFFRLGSLKLTDEGSKVIRGFTKRYLPYAGQNVLSVKAFTDSVKVSKERSVLQNRPYTDNLELSALRSISTMRVLQKEGIPLDRMRISGHGEFSREIQRATASTGASNGAQIGDPLSRKVIFIIESETKEQL